MTLTNATALRRRPADPCTRTTDASGHFAVTFTSTTAGKVTGHASSTLNLGLAAPVTVQTDGRGRTAGCGEDVRGRVRHDRSAIGDESGQHDAHLHGARVRQRRLGRGYVDAPNGTVVTFAFVGAHVGYVHRAVTRARSRTAPAPARSIRRRRSAGDDTMSASTTLSVGGVVLDPDDRAGGAGSCERRQRDQELGRAGSRRSRSGRRDERGRPAAHVHGDALEGHGRRASGRRPTSTSSHADGLQRRDSTRRATGSCTTAGANTDANGQCTITFTSNAAGHGDRRTRRRRCRSAGHADHGLDGRRRATAATR